MKLLTKFNLLLLLLFGAGGLIISQVISSFLLRNARQEVFQEASRSMMGAGDEVAMAALMGAYSMTYQLQNKACVAFNFHNVHGSARILGLDRYSRIKHLAADRGAQRMI